METWNKLEDLKGENFTEYTEDINLEVMDEFADENWDLERQELDSSSPVETPPNKPHRYGLKVKTIVKIKNKVH